jgi:hypothetical protein
MSVGTELLNVPFPEMIKNLGLGIAEAQYALDKVSIKIAQLMAGFTEGPDGQMVPDETTLIKLKQGQDGISLLSLGFIPTFYQFVDTVIELKMAISMKKESEFKASISVKAAGFGGAGFVAASVNASYAQKYQYSAEGSSLMRTKLVTVPAPAMFEQRIKEMLIAEESAKQ